MITCCLGMLGSWMELVCGGLARSVCASQFRTMSGWKVLEEIWMIISERFYCQYM